MTYLYFVAGWIAATALVAAAYDAVCRRRRLIDFLDWCFEHCIDLRGVTRRELHHYAQHHRLLAHVGYDLAALGRRLAAIQQLTDMPARERLRTLLLDDAGRKASVDEPDAITDDASGRHYVASFGHWAPDDVRRHGCKKGTP